MTVATKCVGRYEGINKELKERCKWNCEISNKIIDKTLQRGKSMLVHGLEERML